MGALVFKQKEAKTVRFTCTSGGSAVDLSTATLLFMVKKSKLESDSQASISKGNADFGVASAASGIVTVDLSATDLTLSDGAYVGELKVIFSASNIDKSSDIAITIEKAVIGA
jgi:hypothetical protein